jgi:plasmid stabilization system protein ParE
MERIRTGWSVIFPAEGRAAAEEVARELVVLASLGQDPGDGTSVTNPQGPRVIALGPLMVWYQIIDCRKRVYIQRVTWLG